MKLLMVESIPRGWTRFDFSGMVDESINSQNMLQGSFLYVIFADIWLTSSTSARRAADSSWLMDGMAT